jgi:hypothetical protein
MSSVRLFFVMGLLHSSGCGLGDQPMSSQKTHKIQMPEPHFGQSFAISLAAIIVLTLALPMLAPASKPSSSASTANPVRAIVK